MYFNQISVDGMGCLSYVIGCPQAKAMAVVDPKRDIQDYLAIAREEGMQITHVFNTHLHADHVSGDQELRLATGADIYLVQCGFSGRIEMKITILASRSRQYITVPQPRHCYEICQTSVEKN
jgi:glyoxylase-like metal-dependent hydrolase (beta-lactamase superfamily II)